MSQRRGTEVRRTIARGRNAPQVVRYREFNWTPPATAWSGQKIMWQDLNVTARSGGTRDISLNPVDGVLWAGNVEGGTVPLRLVVPPYGEFRGSTATANVAMYRRSRGTVTWRLRPVWGLDEVVTLGALHARTQNAQYSLPVFQIVEPAGGNFAAAGDDVEVEVMAPRDAWYLAATIDGTVRVVEDINGLASDTAKDDMTSGACWTTPTDQRSTDAIDRYDNDIGGIKTRATELMQNLQGKSGEELVEYLDQQVSGQRFTHTTEDQLIWNISDTLQVRYKPNGDGRRGPSFCIEGKTVRGISWSQDTIAFKVMRNGEPGPKGVNATTPPEWVRLSSPATYDAYMDSACDETHITL